MSTRLYPLYQKGNPQLRVFLPNFWMKMVPPKRPVPKNHVHFIIPPQMTYHDVHQYLTKIYNVPVLNVVISERLGQFRRVRYIVKDEDYKMAYVTLAEDCQFEFPDLTKRKMGDSDTEMEDDIKQFKEMKESFKQQRARYANRPGIPNWFN